MMNKKRLITKTLALVFLIGAFVFGAAGFAFNAIAAEKQVSSITVEIDYGDYDGKDLPKGKAGKSYPVFPCVATDNEGNGVGDVRITVKNPSGEIIPQKGGRFETAVVGNYTIEYLAISGIVTKSEKITVTVENYVDTIVYNAAGELVPASAETGNVVFANFGDFSGGTGDLSFKNEIKFGGENVDFTATETGIYFIPEKCGDYTVSYVVCDFVGDEKSVEKTITVTDGENPVMQKPTVPASAISGETLKLPLPDGVLYKGGEKYYLPVSVYYDGAEVGADMQVKNLKAGKHVVKYSCASPLNAANKVEYSFDLTVKDGAVTAGSRLFDNYFDFVNCEPLTGAKKEYKIKTAGAGDASFAFSREIPADYLNFDISTQAGTAEYSELYFVITDSKNSADGVKIKIKRLSSYENLYIAYDDKTKTIINADDGTVLDEIKSYSDGRTFEGFKSGSAFISFEIKGIKKEAEFTLRKIASNVITTDSRDYAAPEFLTNNDYRAVYVSYIGHSVYFPELKAFDLLDKNVSITLTVYDENGVIYEGKGGYTLNITKSGEYLAEYAATDSNGNSKPQLSTVYVEDLIAPVIKVADIKATVKVGEEITLPVAEITDNDTATENIVSYVYVIKGNNRKQLVYGSYRFTEAGEYTIRYAAYDKNQNYTVVEFTVICK